MPAGCLSLAPRPHSEPPTWHSPQPPSLLQSPHRHDRHIRAAEGHAPIRLRFPQSTPALLLTLALGLGGGSIAPEADAALVAYYNFNEGSGTTINDSSGNANHGTLGAAAGFSTNSPFAGGTSFDSTAGGTAAGTAVVPNSSSLQGISDNLTISLWMKADASDQINWVRMLRKGNESNPVNDNSTWMLNRLSDTNRVVTRIDTSGPGGSFNQNRPGTGGSDGLTAFTGGWEHMVLIYEGT